MVYAERGERGVGKEERVEREREREMRERERERERADGPRGVKTDEQTGRFADR